MKTIVYVDGYNFYYGCLKGTPYKWLDIFSLFRNHILPSSSPLRHAELCRLNYFTADILERAARSPDSVPSQMKYLRALGLTYPEQIAVHKGFYTLQHLKAHIVDAENTRLRESAEVVVWKLEEKQSDVRLALEVFQDAILGKTDQIVICTNDTDIAPALEKVRSHIREEELVSSQYPHFIPAKRKGVKKPDSW